MLLGSLCSSSQSVERRSDLEEDVSAHVVLVMPGHSELPLHKSITAAWRSNLHWEIFCCQLVEIKSEEVLAKHEEELPDG